MKPPSHYSFLDLMDFLYLPQTDRNVMYRHLTHCDFCSARLAGLMRDMTQRQEDLDKILAFIPTIPLRSKPVPMPSPALFTTAATLITATWLLVDYAYDF